METRPDKVLSTVVPLPAQNTASQTTPVTPQATSLNAEHVEMSELPPSNLPHETESIPVHDLPTCAEDGLVLSTYPWKKSVQVKVSKLSPVEVDIWCRNTSEYYQYVPDPDPMTAGVKPAIVRGYSSKNKRIMSSVKTEIKTEETNEQTDQGPADLLEHANALIRDLKSITSKPTKKRQLVSKPKKKSKWQRSSLPMGTTESDEITALEKLHSSTVDKLNPIGKPRHSDGSKQCLINCKMCEDTFNSVHELNLHHKQDHGVVKCDECTKVFNTQSSLDKHMYLHKGLPFACEACGNRFPFQSCLDQHMLKHVHNKLACPVKTCSKEFKGQGDLNRHIQPTKRVVGIIVPFAITRIRISVTLIHT